MTQNEYNNVWRILQQECYIPSDAAKVWVNALHDLDYEDTMRNLQQYRDARKYSVRLVPEPDVVREETQMYHGYDPLVYRTLERIRDGCV